MTPNRLDMNLNQPSHVELGNSRNIRNMAMTQNLMFQPTDQQSISRNAKWQFGSSRGSSQLPSVNAKGAASSLTVMNKTGNAFSSRRISDGP